MCNIENNNPNIAKASETSDPFTLTLLDHLSYDYFVIIHLPQWTQPVQLTVIVLPSASLTHTPSFICVLHYLLGPHNSPRAPSTFPFSQPIPQTQNIKGKNGNKNKKKTMNSNNNTTLQMKWYGHTLDINKVSNQVQENPKIPKAQEN